MPSGLVITRLPVPVSETATNRPLPYVIERHQLSAADVLNVQDSPAVDAEAPTSEAMAGAAATSSRAVNEASRARLRSFMISVKTVVS